MLHSLRVSARATLRLTHTPVRSCNELTAVRVFRAPKKSRWEDESKRLFASQTRCRQQVLAVAEEHAVDGEHILSRPDSQILAKKLPLLCPGCGAPSQNVDADAAGFYGSARVNKVIQKNVKTQQEDEIYQKALQSGALSDVFDGQVPIAGQAETTTAIPICDRCHYLLYQSRGESIIHPSMLSIQKIIEESPHKINHIYHVLDAADFPMSLIPNLQNALDLPLLRTQNRRSKSMRYVRGRVAEVSFIITRGDLLAPKKEQVDSLLPYLKEVLRDALGKSGKNVRLGNVRCVSAHRGWWTTTVKEDIWNRGGAGWMVGKVNVGKSALYEVVFPKGRNQGNVDVHKLRNQEKRLLQSGQVGLDSHEGELDTAPEEAAPETAGAFKDLPGELDGAEENDALASNDFEPFQESRPEQIAQVNEPEEDLDDTYFDEDMDASLLPPARSEEAYPHMPIVSHLPGTTAAPIRIPFGNGKGELIDLPGIHRSSLDTHIKREHRNELVMRSRVVPEQYTIKPGQSLLLGGIVRITPKSDDMVFLAYPFLVPKAHVTSSDKAAAIQTGKHEDGLPYTGTVETIATESAKNTIKSAGMVKLEWDVTKRRAGPLTDRSAGKQKAANLPFIVYSADILIEGVGWVELVCQIRSRQKSFITQTVVDAFGEETVKKEVPTVPEVEVFTPEGKFVGMRRPMNAWLLGGPKKGPKHTRHARPRQSISMQRRKAGGRQAI